MTGTLRKTHQPVSDYQADYPVANRSQREDVDPPKLDLGENTKRSSLGYGNPSYDDAGDDFEH